MLLVKLYIMQRLTALLEGITDFTYTDADGVPKTVSYDLVGKVFRGQRNPPIGDAKDAMSILEAPRALEGSHAGIEGVAVRGEWVLNVQGWPTEDVLNPSDPAYPMAAAVEQRLGRLIATDPETGLPFDPDYHLFGNRVQAVRIGQSIVLPPTEGLSSVAFFYIPLTITLAKT